MQSKTILPCRHILWICYYASVATTLPAQAAIPDANVTGGVCTHDIECDDGLPCTIDTCNFPPGGPAGAGTCQHASVPEGQPGGFGGPECAAQFGLLCGGCDDGLFCNGAETCQGGVCAPGTPPCTGGQVCSESLDRCQPGPCSSQKTCIGGPTPGAACTGNSTCGTGGLCRVADCEDGLLCNGEETCVAGVCQAGENPCGYGATCSERQCSVGPNVDFCLTDEDCVGGLGTCSLIGPVCTTGRCCNTATLPACGRRLKWGSCSGIIGNAGAACSTGSECTSNTCNSYAASCSSLGGLFYPGDVPGHPIPPGGGVACPINIGQIEVRCPKYGSGVTPHGSVVGAIGMVSDSNVAHPIVGVPIHKLGDDYTLSDPGICVGGTRNGLGCGVLADCPSGGTCNLAGTSVMAVYFVRVAGHFLPNTQVVAQFYDAAGRFVSESYAQRETGALLERLSIEPRVIVPSRGFVVLRAASEFTPDGGFLWASTDAVDVGSNNPNLLWVNDGPVANFLAPNPGILIFEIEGEQTVPPLGACCASIGSGCTDGLLPWVCEGDGNHFLGVGTTCPAPACDTGACCNPTTGACTVGTDADCTESGGVFQGFGTDCDPDCCPQPSASFSGGDRCDDVILHSITVPPIGETSVITITGDNSTASQQSGEPPCYDGPETPAIELGWYEGFSINGCAMVRIDYCCTDPVKRPAYPVLFDSCPCSTPVFSSANPYEFPQVDQARGGPYCDDQNQWATFGPLPAGQYFIPVQSGVPGSFGPYQIHITVQACPTAACCVADQCSDGVNQLQCDALGGVFLAPPQKAPLVPNCSTNPCATGSCCPGPGLCFDVALGQPITAEYCTSQSGTYHGGVRCKGATCQANPVESCEVNSDCPGNDTCLGSAQQRSAPSPCPLCSIEGAHNCQPFEDSFNFTVSDRHVGSAGMLSADDFRPDESALDHLCAWGFYLDGDPNVPNPDCGFYVLADHFLVRIYANNPSTGRSPGTQVAERWASSQRGVVPSSRVPAWLDTNEYGFELTLDSPIEGLAPGDVYWLEISNDVSDYHGTCTWYWSQKTPYKYSFSYQGSGSGYPDVSPSPLDSMFCLNMNFLPIENSALFGACCTCHGNCSVETLTDCVNKNGTWDVNRTTCSGVSCPSGPPANDNCVDGPPLITSGSHTVSNQCATTDGFGPLPTDIGQSQLDFDLWYRFVTPSYCDLEISECRTGLIVDSMLAIYHDPENPAQCPPCPMDSATTTATLAGEAQDESCLGAILGGAGVWRASEQIGRYAMPGECFLIRVGSFPGSRGTAILDISCPSVACDPECAFTPFRGTRFITMCGVINPCLFPHEMVGAIRVHLASLHHVTPPYTGGPSIPFTSFEGQVRWVGPPTQYVESTSNPTLFWAARLQCTPHYQDWSAIDTLYVTGSEIVPSSTYQYELLHMSCQGNENACTDIRGLYTVTTTRWADVESPYNPPDPATQPDFADVSALVNKFKSLPGAPTKGRALLAGVDAFGNVNLANDLDFSHIAVCVDAFRGKPYPYTISSCP